VFSQKKCTVSAVILKLLSAWSHFTWLSPLTRGNWK